MTFDIVTPLLGFNDLKQVTLEKFDDNFMKMQSVENEHISFTLINPFVLHEYDFEVPQQVQDLLELKEDSNLLVYNIVLIQTPIEHSMVNLIGPILFNTDAKKAAQIVLPESTNYGVAEKISTFLKK
jgi:flagellar assembly factor FliW